MFGIANKLLDKEGINRSDNNTNNETNNNNTTDIIPTTTSIYLLDEDLLKKIVGFELHRGSIAVSYRPPPIPFPQLIQSLLIQENNNSNSNTNNIDNNSNSNSNRRKPLLIVIMERLSNPDNVGGIFRSALALGVDAVFLAPNCCDPLYRKAIR